jgi:hypothetical protein
MRILVFSTYALGFIMLTACGSGRQSSQDPEVSCELVEKYGAKLNSQRYDLGITPLDSTWKADCHVNYITWTNNEKNGPTNSFHWQKSVGFDRNTKELKHEIDTFYGPRSYKTFEGSMQQFQLKIYYYYRPDSTDNRPAGFYCLLDTSQQVTLKEIPLEQANRILSSWNSEK